MTFATCIKSCGLCCGIFSVFAVVFLVSATTAQEGNTDTAHDRNNHTGEDLPTSSHEPLQPPLTLPPLLFPSPAVLCCVSVWWALS